MAQISTNEAANGEIDAFSQSTLDVEQYLKAQKLGDVYSKLVQLELHELETLLELDPDDLKDIANELKLATIKKVKFKAAIRKLQKKHKSADEPTVIHITSIEENEINKVEYALKQCDDIQNLCEKYFNQIDQHVINTKNNVNNTFNGIYKSLQKRHQIINKKIDEWKVIKLDGVNKLILNVIEFQNELKSIKSKCDKLFKLYKTKDKSDKLSVNNREKEIKQIISTIFNNNNDNKYKQYQNTNLIQKYIQDNTKLIHINFKQKLNTNKIINFGTIDNRMNKNHFFPSLILNKAIKIKDVNFGEYNIKLKWNISIANKSNNNKKYRFILKYVNDNDEKKDDNWMELKFAQIKQLNSGDDYEVNILNNFLYNSVYKFRIECKIVTPINLVIKSNIMEFIVEDNTIKIDMSKEEQIPLKINSYNGYYSGCQPRRVLESDNNYYLSGTNVIRDDWIIFGINNGNVYYPTKLEIRTGNYGCTLKQFQLKIGNSADNAWMPCNQEIFTTKNREKKVQTFNLDINNTSDKSVYKWKKIDQNKWKEFKLEMLNNHSVSDGNHILVTEFKLFGVPR